MVKSSYHTKVINILKEHTSFTILEEVPIKGALVKGYYDIVLPKLNLIIEVNGQHHFQPIDFGGSNLDEALMNFQIQQLQDKRKREYAESQGWDYLELAWFEIKDITPQMLLGRISACLGTDIGPKRNRTNPTKSQAYSREQYRKWKEWKRKKKEEANVSNN